MTCTELNYYLASFLEEPIYQCMHVTYWQQIRVFIILSYLYSEYELEKVGSFFFALRAKSTGYYQLVKDRIKLIIKQILMRSMKPLHYN